MSLKIVFAGTPDFAIPALKALLASEYEVCAVYTKADSPSGRGLKLNYSPVKRFLIDNYPNIPILQPISLKEADNQKQLNNFRADIMVVIAYGLILPEQVLSAFKYGCINVHASLLPRWRGAAPIQRAILAGDQETGVCIMQMNAGLDTGDVLMCKRYYIRPKDTAKEVHNQLAGLGAEALLSALNQIENGQAKFYPQNDEDTTYAAKINKIEAKINWHNTAEEIDRQVRAFNPWPIAFTYLSGQLLKIWHVDLLSTTVISEGPGTIIQASEQGIDVATNQGIIRVLTVQTSGGKPISAANFLNAKGSLVIPGITCLGDPC